MGDFNFNASTLSLCQRCCSQFSLLFAAHIYSWTVEAEPKGRQLFWIHRRGGLWLIVAIMHRMFTFAIEQSEFLRLCVYMCDVCVYACVCACVCHHFVCVAEVPDSCVPVQYML